MRKQKIRSMSKAAVRARERRALGAIPAAQALRSVEMDAPASQTPFSDNAAAMAQSYREGEAIMNGAFVAEVTNDFEAQLALKLRQGRSGWWNPMLTPFEALREMAMAAAARGDHLNTAVLFAMLYARSKA